AGWGGCARVSPPLPAHHPRSPFLDDHALDGQPVLGLELGALVALRDLSTRKYQRPGNHIRRLPASPAIERRAEISSSAVDGVADEAARRCVLSACGVAGETNDR